MPDEHDKSKKPGEPSEPDEHKVKPSQIPLLDDVFESEQPRLKPRQRKAKENLDLPLDPQPPRTPDLFADPPWSAAAYVAAITEGAGVETAQVLRDHAGDMIETLVQEYSKEIIRRLREELTGLLDELEQDQPHSSRMEHPAPNRAQNARKSPSGNPPGESPDATDPT